MSFRDWSPVGLPKAVSISAFSAGLAGVLIAVYVPNAYDKTIPPLLIIGALLGLTLAETNVDEYARLPLSREWTLISYFAIAGAAVLMYITAFQRSSTVNALLIGLYLLSAIGTLVFESAWGKLALPVGTALLHRAFIYYASATQLGLDALFHNRVADTISSTGTLDPLSTSKYWYTSGYHLLTAASTSVLKIGVRDAAFVSITLVTVVVAPIVIFAILRQEWGPNAAAVGALLFLVAGSSVGDAVHTTPTSLGVVFFALLLLLLTPYLATGQAHYLVAIGVFVAGLAFTHQFSLFVAVVTLGPFALTYTLWSEEREWSRALIFETLLLAAFFIQTFVTKYDGPRGERSTSFFMEVAPEIINGLLLPLRGGGGRTVSFPPGYAVSGADSLTVPQVLGMAILFSIAVAGTIYWLHQHRKRDSTVMGLGVMVVLISLIAFGGALIGTNAFLPRRWFGFLMVPLVILAAPGVLAIATRFTIQTNHALAFAAVLLVVTAPYVVFMFGNSAGSPDGPIFDQAPGASRITTTSTEAQLYQFVDGYAGDSTVVADHHAQQVIERHYGQPSRVYRMEYGGQGTTFENEQLMVYREYASTDHVSFEVVYRNEPVRVFAPLPGPQQGDSVVYSSGQERLIYRPPSRADDAS